MEITNSLNKAKARWAGLRLIPALLLVALQACSLPPQNAVEAGLATPPVKAVVAADVVAVAPPPSQSLARPANVDRFQQPKNAVKATRAQKIDSLAVLLSEGNSNHQDILLALTDKMSLQIETYYLTPNSRQQIELLEKVQASSHAQVVAIGSAAAVRAKSLNEKKVVFAQVFNYQDKGLLDTQFSGVSMIPAADELFSSWISRRLTRALKRLA